MGVVNSSTTRFHRTLISLLITQVRSSYRGNSPLDHKLKAYQVRGFCFDSGETVQENPKLRAN